MTGRGGIPDPGEKVLGQRSFLQENLSGPVDHEEMDGPMAQAPGMHFPPRRLSRHPVILVHHIEEFVKILAHASPWFGPPDPASPEQQWPKV